MPENEQPKIIKVEFHKKVTSKRLQVKVVNETSVSCGTTSSYLIYIYSKLRKEMREKKR